MATKQPKRPRRRSRAGPDAGARQSTWRPTDEVVAVVRRFGRFYTRRLGVLREGLYESEFSLIEARVIYELAQRDGLTASEIGVELGVDPGYLSRVLRRLRSKKLVTRSVSPDDGRRHLLSLSSPGRKTFARLDAASKAEVEGMLAGLGDVERDRLTAAMETVEALLSPERPESSGVAATPRDRRSRAGDVLVRTHGPGDLGWIVERHGAVYGREYGWDARFEGMVAEIVGRFARDFDATRERCWIAERDGRRVGSVLIARKSKRVAQLRLLLVEPEARGLGLGRRLVSECTQFARAAGYHAITLWTNDVLHAARRIYETEGYALTSEEPHTLFGEGLVAQTWRLDLSPES